MFMLQFLFFKEIGRDKEMKKKKKKKRGKKIEGNIVGRRDVMECDMRRL